MGKKNECTADDFSGITRISIYIYNSQLKRIKEICKKRNKSKRIVFLEAIQSYIALFKEGKI